jgi:hypothetical protein
MLVTSILLCLLLSRRIHSGVSQSCWMAYRTTISINSRVSKDLSSECRSWSSGLMVSQAIYSLRLFADEIAPLAAHFEDQRYRVHAVRIQVDELFVDAGDQYEVYSQNVGYLSRMSSSSRGHLSLTLQRQKEQMLSPSSTFTCALHS